MASIELLCFSLAILFPLLIILFNGFHIVDEGHVGLYWRAGALLNYATDPGFHFKLPIITTYENI